MTGVKGEREMKTKALVLVLMLVGLSGCLNVCRLKVISWTGSGYYKPLEQVEVEAFGAPAGMAFDEWEGDLSGMEKPTARKTTLRVDQPRKEITATYTNVPVPVPEFTNPDCGPNVAGTYSEYFRNKYQFQPSGHAGAHWRCKFAWPSYMVKTLGATRTNSKTRIYKDGTMDLIVELPVYAIDYGETGQCSRPDSEWFDPDISIPVRVEFWINGKLSARMRFKSAANTYQGSLKHEQI